MKKRFIFDLDGTLWEQDFEEKDYSKFIPLKGTLFAKYEKLYSRHDIEKLCAFLKKETDIPFTEKILNDWLEFNN